MPLPDGAAAELTIVSVVFENAPLLRHNAALVAERNRELPRWIVVDNSPRSIDRPELPSGVEVVPGVAAARARDRGSLHHARGLEAGLAQVRTRYALLMDADFFVVRREWVAAIHAHVRQRRLALFGSPWHPAWYYQYRYFPSPHFMWIDGEQLPLAAMDLKPRIDADLWWRVINDDRLPVPFRRTLKATRIRDTGWPLYRRCRHDDAIARECLIPHFVPERGLRHRLEARLRRLLPESVCLYPRDDRTWTARTFLRQDLPEAYAAGWEELFWRDEPFAFHLRQVGRSMQGRPIARDADLVARAIGCCRGEVRE